MWFKNLRLFRLIQAFNLPLEQFESQLTEQAFSPCSRFEKSRMGWVNPLGSAAPMINERDKDSEDEEHEDATQEEI